MRTPRILGLSEPNITTGSTFRIRHIMTVGYLSIMADRMEVALRGVTMPRSTITQTLLTNDEHGKRMAH